MSERRPLVAAVASEHIAGLPDQTRAPSELFTGAGSLERAVHSNSEWIWLLAPGAVPRGDALESLLAAAAAAGEPRAALLAGNVCDRAGVSIVRDLPAGDEHHPGVVDAVRRRLLPIRNATFANCLVMRACFARHGLPDARRYGPYADVQWSAQVLREAAGYYVPASVVTLDRRRARRDALLALLAMTRMLGSGAWTRGDALANVRRCVRDAFGPDGDGCA